ncbi:MAG: ATP-binding protein, partial [Gemmatimonadota bacterium]
MGETRVDLLRLLEDLRDAYPGSLEETIVTEIVANALDSGAREISIFADPVARTCTATDDGTGMSRAALSRYHDLAVTSKRRGRGIGFAGVGIKLGLLVSDEVVTETRTPRARRALATSWRLSSRTRAPWRWIEPPGLLRGGGTAVRLYLSNPLSRLLDPGFVETSLLRHFEPLFHDRFDEILAAHYPEGVEFRVNGRPLARAADDPGLAHLEIRVGRQRKPSGVGILARDAYLAEEERGVAVSTLGKVIKRGWDWTGIAPSRADGVAGLIEIPALAGSLMLNKADFMRSGAAGATFLAYRKAVQEAVSEQLEAWGEGPDGSPKPRRRTRRLERDPQSVLAALSEA